MRDPMPQATKALTAGQFLLTTLVVKVAIVAVLSTMLVRFPWFRRILLTEKRDWPERLADDLQSDRRGQQDDDPVDLKPADQPPDVAMEVDEEERRKVPDRFFGANLAEAAAGKSASNGKGQRDPLIGEERRDAHHGAHDRARVRAREQAGEKRACQRQVRGVVVDEERSEERRVGKECS